MRSETSRLVDVANELAKAADSALREKRLYYEKQRDLQTAYETAKRAVIAVRGTSAELDALRAFFAINDEWNSSTAPEYSEALKVWADARDRAYRAILEDSGLLMDLKERL